MRLEVALAVFSILVTLSNISLLLVGEKRPDAYVAMAILIYFVCLATLFPAPIRESRYVRILSYVLIALFFAIVSYRVAQILLAK